MLDRQCIYDAQHRERGTLATYQNVLRAATALGFVWLLGLAGCTTGESTELIPGECLTVAAPLSKESTIAAVEGFLDAQKRHDQECANRLVTDWFIDNATYPEDSPSGYLAGWSVSLNNKEQEYRTIRFGVIEENGGVKIDYLELFVNYDGPTPTSIPK